MSKIFSGMRSKSSMLLIGVFVIMIIIVVIVVASNKEGFAGGKSEFDTLKVHIGTISKYYNECEYLKSSYLSAVDDINSKNFNNPTSTSTKLGKILSVIDGKECTRKINTKTSSEIINARRGNIEAYLKKVNARSTTTNPTTTMI